MAYDEEHEIRKLLKNKNVPREDAWHLMDRFDKQDERAAGTFFTRILWIAAVWVIAFGVSKGAIQEGSVVAFTIKRLSGVLLAAPLLIAIFYHDAAATLILESTLADSLRACIGHANPQLTKEELGKLTRSSNFLEAEDILYDMGGRGVNRFLTWTAMLGAIILGLAPLLALVHVSYLLIVSSLFSKWLFVPCVSVASVIILRALVILFLAFTS